MKAIVLLSGGMDSATLLKLHMSLGHDVKAIGFNYGQRHKVELDYAHDLCMDLDVEFRAVDMSWFAALVPGSSQTDLNIKVPKGRYDEVSMKATVVPNRNMTMMSIATAYAIANKFDAISIAAHAGDHTIYPDCRPEFLGFVGKAIALCDWHTVTLNRPFVDMTKAEIVKKGEELELDFSKTWSCYEGGDHHCGMCGTCVERREAFYLAGVADPTIYGVGAPTVETMVRNDWKLPSHA